MDRTYRARYKNINLSKLFFLLLILLLPISLIWLIVHPHKQIQVSKSIECNQKMALKLIGNVPQTLVGDVEMGQLACFTFHANAGQIISLSTNTTVFILKPDNSSLTIQGKSRNVLSSNGDYLIRINAGPRDIKYQIRLLLESKVVAARKSNEEKKQESFSPYSTR